jgi:WD40 repeat protein
MIQVGDIQGTRERFFGAREPRERQTLRPEALAASGRWVYSAWGVEAGQNLADARRVDLEFHTNDLNGARLVADNPREPENDPMTCAAIASGSPVAVTGHRSGTITVWDLDKTVQLARYRKHDHEAVAVAVSPDGRRALSAARDEKTLWLYRLPAVNDFPTRSIGTTGGTR